MKNSNAPERFRSYFSSKRFPKIFRMWYNSFIRNDRREYHLEDNIGFSSHFNSEDKFGFLYRDCSCYADSLKYWLSVPEFRMELELLCSNKTIISDEIILPIMQSIYDKKILERKELKLRGIKSDFEFALAKSGIRDVRKSIKGKQEEGNV